MHSQYLFPVIEPQQTIIPIVAHIVDIFILLTESVHLGETKIWGPVQKHE